LRSTFGAAATSPRSGDRYTEKRFEDDEDEHTRQPFSSPAIVNRLYRIAEPL